MEYHDLEIANYVPEEPQSSCQRILLSATLTRDPEKIAALSLKDPKYFVVQDTSKQRDREGPGILDVVMEKFSVPASLSVSLLLELARLLRLYIYRNA
jgi:ATP-dependent RNA helicase DDX51/DBP6